MFESAKGEEHGEEASAQSRAELLDALRARMAAIPSRGAATPRRPAAAPDVIPVPGALGAALPAGGLARGTVVDCSASGYVLLGLLAAATASGLYAAVIGMPRLAPLAFHELGGNLEKLAIVDAGSDPLEVANTLLDGIDVVAVECGQVPSRRAEILAARVRGHGAVLIVTHPRHSGARWAHPHLRVESQPAGTSGIGQGSGRLQAVHLDVRVAARDARPRVTRLTMSGAADGRVCWSRRGAEVVPMVSPLSQAG